MMKVFNQTWQRKSWNVLFENEQELFFYTSKFNTLQGYPKIQSRGYLFIESMRDLLVSGLPLTMSQVTALKQSAQTIYKYFQEIHYMVEDQKRLNR